MCSHHGVTTTPSLLTNPTTKTQHTTTLFHPVTQISVISYPPKLNTCECPYLTLGMSKKKS